MMVEHGALESPKVDAAFGMHVQSVEESGKIGYSVGVNSASLDTFILKIQGKGGHSSQPQLCVDPLMIMNQVYQAVNLLVTRETDPAAMVALTCGVAKGGQRGQYYTGNGGTAYRSENSGCESGCSFEKENPGSDRSLCEGLAGRV